MGGNSLACKYSLTPCIITNSFIIIIIICNAFCLFFWDEFQSTIPCRDPQETEFLAIKVFAIPEAAH